MVAVDSVYTAVFATADSTTAKAMSNTANIVGLAIFDVFDVSHVLVLPVLLHLIHR